MLGGEARALALALLFAGCAFGDAGQSTGGTAGPASGTSSVGSSGSASGGAAGGGGLGGAGASSVSSASGGAAGSGGLAGAGGSGGEVPCANSADCGGLTCCATFEGAREVFTCVPTPRDCDPERGGKIYCSDASECLLADDVCCDQGFCAGNAGCPGM
jgi:hypothetical protein